MAKYEVAFKIKVVKSFLAGDGGAKLLARRWAVLEEKIRTWVSHYRLHGSDGLRPKRSVYSGQFKLEVLFHQDSEQLSSRQVAAIYVHPQSQSGHSLAARTRHRWGGSIGEQAATRSRYETDTM